MKKINLFNNFENKSGIYCFKNIVTQKLYIGQAKNLRARMLGHIRELRRNADNSSILQNAWNKYGEENFIIYPIILLPKSKFLMNFFETLLIFLFKSHKSKGGYNISYGGNTPSKNNKQSDETKKRHSDSMKGHYNTKGKSFGKEVGEKHTRNLVGLKKKKDSSSRFVGVYWDNTFERWVASIQVRNESFGLGYYRTEISAALAYNRGAIKYFGKGARLNIISKLEILLNDEIERSTKENILASRSSKYSGVTLDKRTDTWRARILRKGKRISLGYYKEETEAAVAFDTAYCKYYKKEFGLNFPNQSHKEDI